MYFNSFGMGNSSSGSNIHDICLSNKGIPSNHKSQLISLKKLIATNQIAFITMLNKVPIIHYWGKTDITIYNTTTSQKSTLKLNRFINSFASSIAYGMRIFIVGGRLISDAYEVNFKAKTLINKSSMIIAKYAHSLCIHSKCIYSIGGCNGSSYISDCEKYNIASNEWTDVPKLITRRANAASFVFNNKCIYCFCGCNLIDLNSMERLDLSCMAKWIAITVIAPPIERCYINGIQINKQQAIVFGGYMEGQSLNESYMLTVHDDKIECMKCANLACSGQFWGKTSPAVVRGCVYGIDNDRNIHIFNNGNWEIK